MLKLASVALTSVLGVAGIASSVPAEAHPYVTVDVGVPVYYPGYVYVRPAYGHYWHRDCDRDRYEHIHHRWDHGDRRWDHDEDHRWDRR